MLCSLVSRFIFSRCCFLRSPFSCFFFFFFNDPAPTEIYTLSYTTLFRSAVSSTPSAPSRGRARGCTSSTRSLRSEEHTSELQSLRHLVCRLLLEKKK